MCESTRASPLILVHCRSLREVTLPSDEVPSSPHAIQHQETVHPRLMGTRVHRKQPEYCAPLSPQQCPSPSLYRLPLIIRLQISLPRLQERRHDLNRPYLRKLASPLLQPAPNFLLQPRCLHHHTYRRHSHVLKLHIVLQRHSQLQLPPPLTSDTFPHLPKLFPGQTELAIATHGASSRK